MSEETLPRQNNGMKVIDLEKVKSQTAALTVDYILPTDMPVIIQFSGGRSSGFMLQKILLANKSLQNVHVLFENTGREMPETLDFVKDCGDSFGVDIKWLEYTASPPFFRMVTYDTASRNGEPFEELIAKRGYLPNVVTRFCSDELKYRTAKRYFVSLGFTKWYSVIGFRADEMRRVNKILSRKHSRETILLPMAFNGATKEDVVDFWENNDFDLDLKNILGKTPLGNCDGCFMKSEANLANLCKHYPDRAKWWSCIETAYDRTFHKKRSWKDLIDSVEKQPPFAFEEEGYFCESVYGGCGD